MKAQAKEGVVLGFQPHTQGFGWVAFSSPLALYDWGLCHAKSDKNVSCMKRLDKLVARLRPETIVLEAYEGVKRSDRVVRLCRAVVAYAIDQRVEVAIYPRDQIWSCFGTVGAKTRHEVAEAIARSFEPLRRRLPKPRAAWDGPDKRIAIFDAAAAVQAHFQLSASRFLTELNEFS
jgi:Holliday junction resolvasome RuvABC endonuclease subunit